jgi:hypothetical protein
MSPTQVYGDEDYSTLLISYPMSFLVSGDSDDDYLYGTLRIFPSVETRVKGKYFGDISGRRSKKCRPLCRFLNSDHIT